MRQLMKLHYYLVRILAVFTGFCIVFLIVAIGLEAILRALHLGFIPGIIDLSEYALFFIAILAAPWLLNQDQHIKVDIIFSQLPRSIRAAVDRLINLIVLFVVVVILYYSTQVFVESWHREEVIYRDLEIPDWWMQWQIPLAMFLMCIELIQRLFWPESTYIPDSPSKWSDDSPELVPIDTTKG